MPHPARPKTALFRVALALALAQALPLLDGLSADAGRVRAAAPPSLALPPPPASDQAPGVWLAAGTAQEAPPPAPPAGALTLTDALRLAREHNPSLAAVRARLGESRGRVAGARVLPYNPELSLEGGPRVGGRDTSVELDLGVEQQLETGGQRAHRVEAARAGVAVTQARVDALERQVEARVARVFYRLLAARERLHLLGEHERLARAVWEIAVAREEAGDATRFEVIAARLGLAEARRRTLAARAQRDAARWALAGLLGGPVEASGAPAASLHVRGALPSPAPLPSPDAGAAALLDRAVETRLSLAGFPQALRETRAQIRLADAEAAPDVTVGLRYSHDDSGEAILAGVRVGLPVFQRNQGPRTQARAKLLRLQAQAQALRVRVETEVRRALTAYAQAREATRLYDREVLRAQRESVVLIEKTMQAGSTGVAALLSLQREVLAGREGYLSTRLALALARADLLAALGLPQSADLARLTAPAPASHPEPRVPTTAAPTPGPRGENR